MLEIDHCKESVFTLVIYKSEKCRVLHWVSKESTFKKRSTINGEMRFHFPFGEFSLNLPMLALSYLKPPIALQGVPKYVVK